MATSANIMNPLLALADEPASLGTLPDEAFLEFLANMSEVDGEVTDALDMLEIVDEPELVNGEEKSSLPSSIEQSKSDSPVENHQEQEFKKNAALLPEGDNR